MSKHTNGPWLFDGMTVYALESAGFRKREEVFQNRFSALVQGLSAPKGEKVSNARLMAAAPDLLEAIIGLAKAYESIDGSVTHDGSWYSHAISAIAKATGESNE